jgi:hypothetical protein
MVSGGFSATATEIVQEGLRMPPVKLVRQGEICQDIIGIALNNIRVAGDIPPSVHFIGVLPITPNQAPLPSWAPATEKPERDLDSPLEEGGFELRVPPRTERKWEGAGAQSSSRLRRGRRGSARNQRTKPI